MGPSGLDSGSIIQRVQDDGWTRLQQGGVKGTGRASCLSFGAIALLMITAFFLLAALRIHPFLSFVILGGLMFSAARTMSAIAELIWGVGASVAVSRQAVRAGETFKVRCTISRPRNAQGLRVMWQGREEAVLRGYDTTHFAEAFLRQELIDALVETALVEVPPDAMPSFSGKNVRIIWSISVETGGRSVGLAADFPILVLPGRS